VKTFVIKPIQYLRSFVSLSVLLAVVAALIAVARPVRAAETLEMWTYYGDTGPAAKCLAKSADDWAKTQSGFTLKIRNIPFPISIRK
jgi:hypothetical protein